MDSMVCYFQEIIQGILSDDDTLSRVIFYYLKSLISVNPKCITHSSSGGREPNTGCVILISLWLVRSDLQIHGLYKLQIEGPSD